MPEAEDLVRHPPRVVTKFGKHLVALLRLLTLAFLGPTLC
jgi:hypothetical protein